MNSPSSLPPRRPRNRISFTKIPVPGIALLIVALLISWLFATYFGDRPSTPGNASRQNEAIEQAKRAVREKLGNPQSLNFPAKADVQVENTSRYTVRSSVVTTDRQGESHQRSWIVVLQYETEREPNIEPWRVISCDIGQ